MINKEKQKERFKGKEGALRKADCAELTNSGKEVFQIKPAR